MTKAEELFQRKVRDLGCIVCRTHMGVRSDCDVHHILDTGRRIGEMFVLGLCPRHHRYGANNSLYVSRHPHRQEFERRYGTELELLELTKRLA